MPTKTTGKGLQRVTSRVWYVTDPDKPRPREHAAKGARRCFREEEEKTRVHIKIYSYESRFCLLTILMDSQVSKSCKAAVLKQQFLILFLHPPALHLSLSHSDQLQQTVPIIHLFSHSNEKHYKWTRVRLLCCIKALIRIKPYIKS